MKDKLLPKIFTLWYRTVIYISPEEKEERGELEWDLGIKMLRALIWSEATIRNIDEKLRIVTLY
jgi:hypothetical protein